MKITFDKDKKNLIFIKSESFKLSDITTDDILVIDNVVCVEDNSKIVWTQDFFLETHLTQEVKYLSQVTDDFNLIVEIKSQTRGFTTGVSSKKIEKIRLISFKSLTRSTKNELQINELEKRVLKTDTLTITPDIVLTNDELLDESGQLDTLLKQFKRLKNLSNLDL